MLQGFIFCGGNSRDDKSDGIYRDRSCKGIGDGGDGIEPLEVVPLAEVSAADAVIAVGRHTAPGVSAAGKGFVDGVEAAGADFETPLFRRKSGAKDPSAAG